MKTMLMLLNKHVIKVTMSIFLGRFLLRSLVLRERLSSEVSTKNLRLIGKEF